MDGGLLGYEGGRKGEVLRVEVLPPHLIWLHSVFFLFFFFFFSFTSFQSRFLLE